MDPATGTLHVVFKTHLDVGFTNLAAAVVRRYVNEFVPSALSLARSLREDGCDRFIWTVGSWLVWEYLERASSAGRRVMERAIEAGDIAWHALPFTVHSEIMEPTLFEFGLSLSRRLDERFGRQTVAAKMTDVPGHTRAIVPLLARAGVQFLHIGVNPACTPPSVPPVFVWSDEASGTDVIVMYASDYGATACIPGLHDGLSICFTGDNKGPQNRRDVSKLYRGLRRDHPSLSPRASTLDAYAAKLIAVKSLLPVVTKEIGDTWIHGTGSDPKKLAAFRELCRLRVEWLSQANAPLTAEAMDRFSRRLLMVPEHTWGLDQKTHLNDSRTFSKKTFEAARRLPKFQLMERSWDEQRGYLRQAVAGLPAGVARQTAQRRLRTLVPASIRSRRLSPDGAPVSVQNKRLIVSIDRVTGAVTQLHDRRNGHDWADKRHPLFSLCYEVFGQQDYARFLDQYLCARPWWAPLDFGRKGLVRELTEHKSWSPTVRRIDQVGERGLAVELGIDSEASDRFGAPRRFTVEIKLDEDEPVMHVTVQWFKKSATRVPEATWLSLRPKVGNQAKWRLHKLGAAVDPHDVVRNGNCRLHGVWDGASCIVGRRSFRLKTLDAGLIAPGEPSLLNFTNSRPRLERGMHVNLHNTTFSTNFPLWYEDDARFRFELTVG